MSMTQASSSKPPLPSAAPPAVPGGPSVPAEPALPASTPAPRSTIETDTYCGVCGFNLHTQPVWKDERLGILLARCPECGSHHPAGTRTTAPNAWLGRLAFLGLVVWVILCLTFVVGSFLTLIGIHMAAQDGIVATVIETRDGREVDRNYGSSTTQPSWTLVDGGDAVDETSLVRAQRLPTWLTGRDRGRYQGGQVPLVPFLLLSGFFVAVVWFIVWMIAIITWFWPPRRRLLWMLLPTLVTVVAFVAVESGHTNGNYYYGGEKLPFSGPRLDCILLAIMTLLQMLAIAFGLWVGRPIARLALRLILPPRARQYFTFLWLCDGLTPPLKP